MREPVTVLILRLSDDAHAKAQISGRIIGSGRENPHLSRWVLRGWNLTRTRTERAIRTNCTLGTRRPCEAAQYAGRDEGYAKPSTLRSLARSHRDEKR